MGRLNIKGFRGAKMPSCCGNCKYNRWEEYGPLCRNPKNWAHDDYEIEEGIATPEMDDDDGEINWDNVCDNYEAGNPWGGPPVV